MRIWLTKLPDGLGNCSIASTRSMTARWDHQSGNQDDGSNHSQLGGKTPSVAPYRDALIPKAVISERAKAASSSYQPGTKFAWPTPS
jgi:hypothetical protein